jgi:hypothetical protein
MVKFEKLAGITPRGDCGLAVQVLIHEVCWDWAPAPSARSNPIKALEMSARENVGRIRVLPISVCLCALKRVKRRIMIGPGFLPGNYQKRLANPSSVQVFGHALEMTRPDEAARGDLLTFRTLLFLLELAGRRC